MEGMTNLLQGPLLKQKVHKHYIHSEIWMWYYENEKKDNKQCSLDTPAHMQSIRSFQQKLWFKSISLHMHYLSTKQTPLKKQKCKKM